MDVGPGPGSVRAWSPDDVAWTGKPVTAGARNDATAVPRAATSL
jgi:hypothetical protein